MVESSDQGRQEGSGGGTGRDASLSVRRAGPADARAIAVISTLGWQRAYRGILPDEFLSGLKAEPRETAWRASLEAEPGDDAPVWVAERGGETIGFVSSGPTRDEDLPSGSIEVYAIYVLPDVWRAGAGRLLLETATRHARKRGATTLTLWVLEENEAARRFYEALGWRHDGGRQMFELRDVGAPELRYRLDLDAPAEAARHTQPAEPAEPVA